jgi:phosphate uptake regulator
MDTRKVQRTGKSTYIVSLPKNWATKSGIHAGSIIYITQSDNGSLILSTDRSERELKVRLEIGERVGDPLIRDIIGCYLAGYRTIEVTSSRMSPTQKKDLHQIVNKLIGPEILEETISKVVIQDLLSSEELQSERALKRIRTVVKSMIQDAMASLTTNNKELAADVVERDNDIDRLNLLISRQFTEILRSGSIKQEALDPITAFNYMQAASNLERIADHAASIARVVKACDCILPEDVLHEIRGMESLFGELIDDSISHLVQANSDKANEIISKAKKAQMRAEALTNSSQAEDKDETMVRVVVASSIERMLDYIMNIAELTINLRQAQLQG